MAWGRAFAHLLAAPLLPALRPRVEARVAERLSDGSFGDPADLREVGQHVVHARRALDEIGADVTELRRRADAVGARPRPPSPSERVDAVVAGMRALADRVAAVRALADAADERIAAVEQRAAAVAAAAVAVKAKVDGGAVASAAAEVPAGPAPSTPGSESLAAAERAAEVCAVDGCGGRPRARGLCGKHYQLLRRGHLPGFVDAEGRVTLPDGVVIQVDAGWFGRKATVADGVVRVGEQIVAS